MHSGNRARSVGVSKPAVTGECGRRQACLPTQGRRGLRIRGSCPHACLQRHLGSLGPAVAGMRARAVAKQSTVMRPGAAVPHHGPVSPDCLIDCLMTVLPLMRFHPLTRACDAPSGPPRTPGDVVAVRGGQPCKIRGLGRHRISGIEAGHVLAGLAITPGPAATRAGRPRLRTREDG